MFMKVGRMITELPRAQAVDPNPGDTRQEWLDGQKRVSEVVDGMPAVGNHPVSASSAFTPDQAPEATREIAGKNDRTSR